MRVGIRPTRRDADQRMARALEYRDRGFALLPLEAQGKKPNAKVLRHVHGSPGWGPLANRPASEPEILAWFEADPDANLGIICGQASGGIVVADFDRPTQSVTHPPTPAVCTSRGYHVYFRSDARQPTRSTSWGELRGEGAYAVAPPSIHPSGGAYAWTIGLDDCPFAHLSSLRDGGSETSSGLSIGSAYELPIELATRAAPTRRELRVRSDDSTRLGADPGAVAAALPVLGIGAPLGKPFCCVLPGHGVEHPSASIYRDPSDGVYRYRDWHRADGIEWLSLAEVHAARVAGRVGRLQPPEAARWWDRLFYDAGLLPEVVMPQLTPTPSALSTLDRVAHGFALLFALRRLRARDGNYASPYTASFASRWCGIPEVDAQSAIAELRRRDVILKVAQDRTRGRPLNLYVPGRDGGE